MDKACHNNVDVRLLVHYMYLTHLGSLTSPYSQYQSVKTSTYVDEFMQFPFDPVGHPGHGDLPMTQLRLGHQVQGGATLEAIPVGR